MSASRDEKRELKSLSGDRATGVVYDSRELLGSFKEILINHAGEIYRLRVTRQNKLILTK